MAREEQGAAGQGWTLERLRELSVGYRLPLVVLTLVRLGVMDLLAQGARTAAEAAAARGLDEEALARVLDALVAVGILVREDGRYAFANGIAEGMRDAAKAGDPARALDGLRHTADGLDKWMMLPQVLRCGRAEYGRDQDVTADPGRNDNFIRAMYAFGAPAAARLAELLPRQGARTFMDLGGGPGTFCYALMDRWPDLEATLADLPLTLEVARRIAAERGAQGRLKLLQADFYDEPACDLGGPYDLVLVSAVIHAEGLDRNRDLVRRVRAVVAPGGRIVVRENLLADDRSGPPRASLFDVHMLVSTRRGRCYTLAEVSQMLMEAGFAEPALLGSFDDGFVVAST